MILLFGNRKQIKQLKYVSPFLEENMYLRY